MTPNETLTDAPSRTTFGDFDLGLPDPTGAPAAGGHTRLTRLGVVGAGTMGSGIAALAASAGIPVVLLDIPADGADRNAIPRGAVERAVKAIGRAPCRERVKISG